MLVEDDNFEQNLEKLSREKMYERPLIPTKSLSNIFGGSPEKGHLHIIVWHPFPTELSLSYWIIGGDPKKKHSVVINSSQRIEYLQQAIKEGHRDLEGVDAAKLKLWQAITDLLH